MAGEKIFGRVTIQGHTYKKIFMKKRIVYKVEIDGVIYYEEYPTVEKAMEGARLYFKKDHSLREANIIKYTTDNVGITIINKDYEKDIVK